MWGPHGAPGVAPMIAHWIGAFETHPPLPLFCGCEACVHTWRLFPGERPEPWFPLLCDGGVDVDECQECGATLVREPPEWRR